MAGAGGAWPEAALALAHVARRQGSAALPETVWVGVLSLELGWMAPSAARAYVAAARQAGLLLPGPADAQPATFVLAFDPARAVAPVGFRPSGQMPRPEDGSAAQAALASGVPPGAAAGAPHVLGARAAPGGRAVPAAASAHGALAGQAQPAAAGAAISGAAGTGAAASGPAGASPAAADPFLAAVDALAQGRKVPRATVLGDVAALQDRMGGLIDALAAVLVLSQRAGLDVREAARQELSRRQAAAPPAAAAPR